MSVRTVNGTFRVYRDGKEVARFTSLVRLSEYIWTVEEVERAKK